MGRTPEPVYELLLLMSPEVQLTGSPECLPQQNMLNHPPTAPTEISGPPSQATLCPSITSLGTRKGGRGRAVLSQESGGGDWEVGSAGFGCLFPHLHMSGLSYSLSPTLEVDYECFYSLFLLIFIQTNRKMNREIWKTIETEIQMAGPLSLE